MRKKLLYTKKEVAQALGCSIGKIDKLMASCEYNLYRCYFLPKYSFKLYYFYYFEMFYE